MDSRSKLETPRSCEIYSEEFHNCERPKARFHQYFIYGDYSDCSSWQQDKQNCKTWLKNKDVEAYEKIIENEKKRRIDRLKGHVHNDVWNKRDAAPANWNAPLPEWWMENNKSSYLIAKSKMIKDGSVNDLDLHVYNSCAIL